jgi:hypothetical protein
MNFDNIAKKTDLWIANGWNVLMVGDHGIGKTAIIKDAFERNNLKWKYFSASTMDPWVDFVGVPKEVQGEDGSSYLDLIQRKEFQDDTIEALFFDEFNRAPDKVRNAVMELIQFKAINGRPLTNLKCVWAAINPYDENETYDVEELDPAQEDRFQIQIELPNEPNKRYFQEKYGARMGTRAVEWWIYLPDNLKRLVSPRRLDYAIDVYTNGGDLEDVLNSEVRPKTLRRKIESISATTTHADKWLKDGEGYLAEVADRKSTIDVIAAFEELQDVSMDQAVSYLTQLPSNKLNQLATSSNTVGILVRHAAMVQPSNRKVMTALSKNRFDTFMMSQDRFSEFEQDDREFWVLARGCQSDQPDAWKTMVQLVQTRIANDELGYNECELLLILCCNPGGPAETKTVGNLIYHFVEEYHPHQLAYFVSIAPSFIVDVYNI